jgi:septum formation protein
MTRILLASNSARRRQLMTLTGWEVIHTSPDIDESRHINEPAFDYVTRLAKEKAEAVLHQTSETHVLAADTIVVDHETIFGKPEDTHDARSILFALRGHSHQVMTAITLIDRKTAAAVGDMCVSNVPMRHYSAEEVDNYIRSGDPLDKAGAYAIQNLAFHPVEAFSGCYASVMGLPLCHLERSAAAFGLVVQPGLADRCQAAVGYRCPIYRAVLRGDIIG